MSDTRYSYHHLNTDLAQDMAAWARLTAEDNQERLDRMRRSLRKARETELTACQKRVLEMHYDRGMGVREIAQVQGVAPSTVSRTLRRARERLRRCLKYTL